MYLGDTAVWVIQHMLQVTFGLYVEKILSQSNIETRQVCITFILQGNTDISLLVEHYEVAHIKSNSIAVAHLLMEKLKEQYPEYLI